MFKNTLLALAAGGAIMLGALTGSAATAKADTSVHVGIGLPGVHLVHSRDRSRCWLPERHLCGPSYGRPVYGGPVYGGPIYYPPYYGRPVYGWPVYRGGYRTPPPYHYRPYRRW
jgi:hypothetical protein